MTIRLGVAQITPDKGSVSANLDLIAEVHAQASEENLDLVCLPETSTTGYFLQGGVVDRALTAETLVEELSGRRPSGSSTDLILGFYERTDRAIYNAAAYLEATPQGFNLKGIYRKFFLPTYSLFDESRFVARGHTDPIFHTRFGAIGILICEDSWHGAYRMIPALEGAPLVVVLSASPIRGLDAAKPASLRLQQKVVQTIAEEHSVFVASSMLNGFEGGKGMAGGSVIFSPTGAPLVEAPDNEDAMVVAEIELNDVILARQESSMLADLRESMPALMRRYEQLLSRN